MRGPALLVSALVVALVNFSAAGADASDGPPEKRELLANHETLAVFDGVNYRLCRGRTALCPERCGDSGEFANFRIKKYLKYEKPGQYGDPQQTTFLAQVSDYHRRPKGDPRILETVKTLKPGDHVLLSWRHDYVTRAGASFPERPIVKLEKIDDARAEELMTTSAPAAERPQAKSFVYKKTKQADLELVVHYPPGWKETDQRPAIVFFFGGGWSGGTIEQFTPQATHLANRGMVAARADYRVKSRHGVTPKECVEDAKSAVRWIRQNAAELGVDPDRIVAGGGSAGGHLAACTALTPGLDATGEIAQVSSKPNALALFNPVLRFSGIPRLMQRIGDDETLGKAISPTLHLTKDSPPTLILFGTADPLAVMGDEFMERSKELGHRAELFTAEGQNHGFFNRSPWLEKTTQRLDEFLVSLGYLAPNPEGK